MNRRMVVVTGNFSEDQLAGLGGVAPDLGIRQFAPGGAETIPEEAWRDAEILYTYSTLPVPEQAPMLRWVQLHSAGADHLRGHPLLDTSVRFTTASGVHAVVTAEHVFTMVLAWQHKLGRILEWRGRPVWPPDAERAALFAVDELWGQTIGLVGYGSIARQVARLARAFGMRVLALHRSTDHRDTGYGFPGVGDRDGTIPDAFYPPEDLLAMLEESDVVVVAVPSTPSTVGFIDEGALRAMGPRSFLVNVARGDVCDEIALQRALRDGWIGGAALDVFHREPLSDDDPMWGFDNVIISPHVAGFTRRYGYRAAQLFQDNLRRYCAGDELWNLVTTDRGY